MSEKSRNAVFFQWFVCGVNWKVGSLKWRVRPGSVLLRLYIPALCISIFGRPFKFLVVLFPLHFRAPSLPRRSTHARIWTPPCDASCQWVWCPALHLKPGLQSSTHSMHLANEFDARLQHPFHLPVPPLWRNLLLPQFCCLIRLCYGLSTRCLHLCVAEGRSAGDLTQAA